MRNFLMISRNKPTKSVNNKLKFKDFYKNFKENKRMSLIQKSKTKSFKRTLKLKIKNLRKQLLNKIKTNNN